MKLHRCLGILTLFISLNSVLAQKLVKAKKVKLYDGIVCYENSKDPFTGIVSGDYIGIYSVFMSENFVTENSKYVIEEFFKGFKLYSEYSGIEMYKYAEYSFNDGKLDGLTAVWSNKKSNLISELNFKNGVLEGISSVWDKKGNKKFEGSFKNGIQDGLVKEWYSKGNKKFEGSFKNGKKDSLHIYWNENGDWSSIKNYDVKGIETYLKKEDLSQEIRDMLPNKVTSIRTNNREVLYINTSILFSGVYQEYYSNGDLDSEHNYKNGKKDGLCKEWYSDGKLEYEYNYKNGKKDGLCKEWYSDGKLEYEYNYKNGERDGLCKEWYSNGNQKFEGSLKNGKKDGLVKEWYSDGKLEYEYNYKNGEKDGLCKEWYSNGNQKFEGSFKNGKKDSLCILWTGNGTMNIYKYENGKNIPVLKDDLNQKLLNKLNIPSSVNFSDLKEIDDIYYYKNLQTISFSGRIKEFYANGKLKLDFNFSNGYIVLQKWYFANGLLAELADYEKREFKVYHNNGKLRYESENKVTENYNGGINNDVYRIYTDSRNTSGWHKEYHENGKLYKQFKIIESTGRYDYKNYNLDSIYKEWYSNGLQSKKFNYINGILEGSYKEWHKNGKLEIQASYINGKKEGPYKEWHDNGRLHIQTNYVNGKKEGPYKEWHDNGRLHIQTNYVNGEKDGLYKYWSYDGRYYESRKYRSGEEY